MASEPNSYGTGRDPQRTGNYLVPVLFLLLFCIAVHGLTLLYLRKREQHPQRAETKLSLDELPTEEHENLLPIQDNCGLGLELSDISEIQQRYWSLPDGVFIEQIQTNSTAYEAGLRSGDLLLQIEDQKVSNAEDCLEILESYCQEEILDLIYFRDGEEHSLRIPLAIPEGE